MTPMIDVIFQLLIFFLCTVSFQQAEELLPTSLLAQGSVETVEPIEIDVTRLDPLVIRLLRDGSATTWRIQEQPLESLAQLEQTLLSLARLSGPSGAPPLVLDSAPEVPLGDVIDVYDRCRALGFLQIQFAARAER